MEGKRIAVIETGAPGIDSLDALFIMAGLGPLSISSYLASQGHQVKFFAMMASPQLDEDYIRSCDYVLFSVMTHTAKIAYRLSDRFRPQPGQKPVIIFGGVHAGVLMEDALDHCDYAVVNEGEATVHELIAYLEEGHIEMPRAIHGIAFKDRAGQIVRTPQRSFMSDIDFPLDPSLIHDYPSMWRDFRANGRIRRPIALMNFSRGCPYACSFCLGMRQLGKEYRTRPANQVISDLNKYHQVTHSTYGLFHDNEFTINRRKTKELLRAFIDEKPAVRNFTVFARIESTKDEELWELFERAGVGVVVFGVESLNQSTLDVFIKRTEVEAIYEAMERISKYNVTVIPSFIIGDVDDPLEELRLIKKFWRRYYKRIQRIIVAPLMEYPNQTKYRGQAQLIPDEQFIHHDWDFYSGDFLFFYPRSVPPSVLQKAMLDTISGMMTVPINGILHPYNHLSAWFVRHTYAPMRRKIGHYIEYLKFAEQGKYDRHGHLIRSALAKDVKLSEIPIEAEWRPYAPGARPAISTVDEPLAISA